MLLFDVSYVHNGQPTPDYDPAVTAAYLSRLPQMLREGEIAYARCINGSNDHDRVIYAAASISARQQLGPSGLLVRSRFTCHCGLTVAHQHVITSATGGELKR